MFRARTRTFRTLGSLVLGLCLGAAAWAPVASADGAAPAPVAPIAGASFVEGRALNFTWTGGLQGTAPDRASFRIEVAAAADVPSGQDADWPSLVNWVMTDPGVAATSATMGAPDAGSFRWRVCAWGVQAGSDEITRISCSASRTLTTTAAAIPDMGSVGEVALPGKTTNIAGANRVVVKTTIHTLPAEPAKNIVKTVPAPPKPKATFDVARVKRAAAAHAGGKPLVKAPDLDGLLSTENDSGWGSTLGNLGHLGAGALSALGWHLPGVPIPFWTLLLLFMPIPLAFWWKRSVLGMFDMPTVSDLSDESLRFDEDLSNGSNSPFKEIPAGADGAPSTAPAPDPERLAA
jgi:hypothetical protein